MPAHDSESTSSIRWELPSQAELLEGLVDDAESFLTRHVDDEDLVYRAMLLLSEAATNAMKHGNRFDPEKMVRIEMSLEDNEVRIRVCDEGVGFEADKARDPLEQENLFHTSGRGIFLIREMANEVAYEDGGRCVTIRVGN